MVLLLALRGLLGDAMAMQMLPIAAPTHSASHTANPARHAAPDVSVRSHHGTAETASANASPHPRSTPHCATAPGSDHGDHSDNSTHCSTCALCHAAWCPHTMAAAPPGLHTGMRPRPRAAEFVSATLHSLTKPPIV